MVRVDGIGCVMREWRDEVLLGMINELSAWSRVEGRSRVDGRMKMEWSLMEGAMAGVTLVVESRWCGCVQWSTGMPWRSSEM